MAALPRSIAHLDMDAFYASVELLRRPQLRGLPVVVGGRRALAADTGGAHPRLRDYVGRGVITTASYEARALGVHSGMGLMKAALLAPDALLLPADFDAYRHHSRLFKAAVHAIAPEMEDRGIDEIYLDLSALNPDGSREGARAIALRLQQAVQDATGLSCSLGVAPNKLLAKLCSDLQKPAGITVIAAEDIPTRIWPLPARRINGIGPKAASQLDALGIHTIGELGASNPAVLQSRFGARYGLWLYRAAHGDDDRPVITRSEPKSLSRESTFERDLHPRLDRDELSVRFTRLCEQLATDLERKGYLGKTVGLKLRFDNFHTVTRDLTLPHPVGNAQAIRRAAGTCLKRIPLERRIRLLGVRVATLVRPDLPAQAEASGPVQTELFS
ncbi:DNA polymerase IV [Zoogloea sp.]|uniref:DNA polymerase IV n=1 Tax=Zoogloea sp. TaxID=49181 RepID=UPI0026136D1A|nr:DNA polymerase IV [Zoogloea sp.]MDD3352484.1 DNA polymerase IV [Zoogloea sp.]